jgi:23S rRNA (adenine2503-C2)-methyltransferase
VKVFFDQLKENLLAWVESPARAGRVFKSVYQQRVKRFEDIDSLPAAFRRALAESLSLELPRIRHRYDSEDGTRRYLLELQDGETVESVLIPSDGRVTVCLSSQVGCALGCTFCLTGQLGLIRDLSAGEIVSQMLVLEREASMHSLSSRSSVVLMGMGEPLHNYDNVLTAIQILHDDHGLGIPMSRITLSTAGLIPGIQRLANERLFPNLSISLTGVTNSTRDALMPINKRYPIEQLIEAVRSLPPARQSRVMMECVMIDGVTDSPGHARELSRLLDGLRVKVNLIPLNPAAEIPFQRSGEDSILRFQKILMGNGTATFIRKNRGNDVSGACGQLKKKMLA